MSEPGETRTLDPRIKSALLYRLSYRLRENAGMQQLTSIAARCQGFERGRNSLDGSHHR